MGHKESNKQTKHRGSYVSAQYILLSLLNKLGKRDKMGGFALVFKYLL